MQINTEKMKLLYIYFFPLPTKYHTGYEISIEYDVRKILL